MIHHRRRATVAVFALLAALLLLQITLGMFVVLGFPPHVLHEAPFLHGLLQSILIGLPLAITAYFGVGGLRRSQTLTLKLPAVVLVATWCITTAAAWVVLYLLLAGPNPGLWSAAPVKAPESWVPTVLAAIGLALGASRRAGAA